MYDYSGISVAICFVSYLSGLLLLWFYQHNCQYDKFWALIIVLQIIGSITCTAFSYFGKTAYSMGAFTFGIVVTAVAISSVVLLQPPWLQFITRSNSISSNSTTLVYNTHTYVTYRFINVTKQSCDWMYNDSTFSSLSKIQEIISNNYLDEELLPTYDLFQLTINKINGHSVEKERGQLKLSHWDINWCYDLIHPHTGLREMHAKSTIDHTLKYQNYFERTTVDTKFWNRTTWSFHQYFNNPYLN
eukprot:4105_1